MARSANIKSGWNVVFLVLKNAAHDSNYSLAVSTFDLVKFILANYFSQIVDALTECADCLVAFGRNIYTDCRLAAIDLLVQVLHGILLTEDPAEPAFAGREVRVLDVPDGVSCAAVVNNLHSGQAENVQVLKVLFIALKGLVTILADSNPDVRARALQALLAVLRNHGHTFGANTWRLIFNGVLFPIFDLASADVNSSTAEIKSLENKSEPLPMLPRLALAAEDTNAKRQSPLLSLESAEWLQSTCVLMLQNFVDVFSRFRPALDFLLPDFLHFFNHLFQSEVSILSRAGIKTWSLFIGMCGISLSSEQWQTVIQYFSVALRNTLPEALTPHQMRSILDTPLQSSTEPSPSPTGDTHTASNPLSLNAVRAPLATQLLLAEAVFQTLFQFAPFQPVAAHSTRSLTEHFGKTSSGSQMNLDHILLVVDALLVCARFVGEYNSEEQLRLQLKDVLKTTLPNLFYHQGRCLEYVMATLFRMFSEGNDAKRHALVQAKCLSLSLSILQDYVHRVSYSEPEALTTLDSVLVIIIQGFSVFSPAQFTREIAKFVHLFSALVGHGSQKVRTVLVPLLTSLLQHAFPAPGADRASAVSGSERKSVTMSLLPVLPELVATSAEVDPLSILSGESLSIVGPLSPAASQPAADSLLATQLVTEPAPATLDGAPLDSVGLSVADAVGAAGSMGFDSLSSEPPGQPSFFSFMDGAEKLSESVPEISSETMPECAVAAPLAHSECEVRPADRNDDIPENQVSDNRTPENQVPENQVPQNSEQVPEKLAEAVNAGVSEKENKKKKKKGKR